MLQMFEASPVPVTNLPHSKDVLPAVLRLSSLADHGAMEARVTGITSAPHQHSVNDVCWRQPDLRCYAAQYDANYQQPQLQYLPYSCSRQQSQIVMTQSRDAFCPPAFNSNNCMDAASYTSQQTYPMYGYVGAPSRTSSFHAGYHPCCSCQQMPSYLNIESPGVATPNMLPTIQCRHNQQFNM
jgi:hypothetical protein